MRVIIRFLLFLRMVGKNKKVKSVSKKKGKVAPKKVAPKKVAPKKVAPKKVAPKKVAPKKVAPKKIAPKKIAPKKVIRKKVTSKTEVNTQELKWDQSISVTEKTIDAQHKKILSQIVILEKAALSKDSLPILRQSIHFLSIYIKDHLAYEENYMEKNKYPKLEEHKKIHEEFIKSYEKFKDEFTMDTSKGIGTDALSKEYAKKIHKFLGWWWMNHIKVVDHKYCEFISGDKCGGGVGKKIDSVDEKEAKSTVKKIDVSEIAKEIKAEQISSQRAPLENLPAVKGKTGKAKKDGKEYVMTGVAGFDELLDKGIPKGSAILVAGGAGSGKTIFSLQTLVHQAGLGKKCLYMSFEEREERLVEHMNTFGWGADKLIKKGMLKIQRISPFEITRNVDALLAKEKGELLIDIDPVIIPKGFKPDFIALDSLTAIASAFTGKEDGYRIYIEQLFRFFEKIGATSFLITETEQIPKIFSTSGVEEFLADGVVVFYNLKHGNVRENAIEILKLRGAAHQKKIVAMQITGEGIVVYPEQEVFSEIEG